MNWIFPRILLALVCLMPCMISNAQPGVLDPTFGNGGKLVLDLFGASDNAKSVLIQPDGKILVAGSTSQNFVNLFFVLRLNEDGSFDTSFGNNGVATCSFDNNNASSCEDMLLLPDGKILLGGSAFIGFASQLALAKFTSDGQLDTSFNGDGKVNLNIGANFYGQALGVMSDGRIVFAGSSNLQGYTQATLVRLTVNGILDNAFGGGDGITTTQVGDQSGIVEMVVTSGDVIYAVGRTGGEFYNDALILSYNYPGSLNTAFDSDGIKTLVLEEYDDYFTDIVELPGSRFLISGVSNIEFVLAQVNASGSMVSSFSGDGILKVDMNDSFDELFGVAVDPMGHFVAAGHSGYNLYDNAVLRVNANGTMDNLFSLDGKATVDIVGTYDYTYAVAVQDDGKIVAVGTSDVNGQNDLTVYRLQGVCAEITANQSVSICAGESINVGGNSHSISGLYTDVLVMPSGCDSTVITNLTVLPNSAISQEVSIIAGDSYTIGNSTYTSAGTYVDVLESANGCDSVVTTVLSVGQGFGDSGKTYELVEAQPVPFTDELRVAGLHEKDVLELRDIAGKLIVQWEGTSETMLLNTSGLKAGMYWLVQRNAERMKVRKVMKVGKVG